MGEVLGREVPRAQALDPAWEPAIRARLDALGARCDADAPGKLARYHALLAGWNQKLNLVGDADFGLSLDRHYVDSLAPLALPGLFPAGASLVDVGSGAGFPGLALAVARPDLRVTLVDALGKRVDFLNAAARELGLHNVRVLPARAEDAGRDPALRERFDLAAARAVAALPVLCELLLPLARVGGRMIAYKGPAAGDELEAGARAAALLGGGAPEALPVPMPSQPEWRHILVVCPKLQKTVRQYPRKAGTPAKDPLGALDKS